MKRWMASAIVVVAVSIAMSVSARRSEPRSIPKVAKHRLVKPVQLFSQPALERSARKDMSNVATRIDDVLKVSNLDVSGYKADIFAYLRGNSALDEIRKMPASRTLPLELKLDEVGCKENCKRDLFKRLGGMFYRQAMIESDDPVTRVKLLKLSIAHLDRADGVKKSEGI